MFEFVCGRFTSLTPPDELAEVFSAEMTQDLQEASFEQNYNVAPSMKIMAVALATSGARRLGRLRWGLVPSWAKEAVGTGHVNARSETVADKPSFRDSFNRRRCIIPVSGYYEWRTVGDSMAAPGSGRSGKETKRAVYVTRSDGAPMAVAGLWSVWTGPNAGPEEVDSREASHDRRRSSLKTCCIVTREANDLLSAVHDRMPVVLEEDSWSLWLGEEPNASEESLSDLMSRNRTQLQYFDVGSLVNSVRNNGPDLILPVP